MATFVKHMVICHAYTARHLSDHHPRTTVRCSSPPPPSSSAAGDLPATSRRWAAAAASAAFLAASALRPAAAESWGTRSYIKERYFQPEITPEESVARIRQTAEGLRSMRHMLDTMSWRYVLFYVRFKMAYLSSDLKNAMATLPENRRNSYVKTANELVDHMTELDRYVRTPKVYESYLYYEKTLRSLDDLVAQLA
uniref:Oxygen-evolving enhancer protein 3-2, chloroplastic n=1 Tax=Anthurium amnicola TaxID=1678845 RepID=A0A1D1Y6J0_9ARAE